MTNWTALRGPVRNSPPSSTISPSLAACQAAPSVSFTSTRPRTPVMRPLRGTAPPAVVAGRVSWPLATTAANSIAVTPINAISHFPKRMSASSGSEGKSQPGEEELARLIADHNVGVGEEHAVSQCQCNIAADLPVEKNVGLDA